MGGGGGDGQMGKFTTYHYTKIAEILQNIGNLQIIGIPKLLKM